MRKLSQRPWLAALIVLGMAGGTYYARACFVRAPQPVQVWMDEIEVDITDQVAVKRYKCTFLNPNSNAVVGGVCYMEVEPGAQVDKMSLQLDGKEVKGEVLDVDKANRVFTDIVRRGGSPALLEYYGNKLITTKIPRIAPNGKVTVNLQYTTVIKRKGNLVRINVLNTNPKAALQPLKRASVTVRIRSKDPVRNVYSPTHDIRVVEGGAKDVLTVRWSQEQYLPMKPFVMYYAVSGKQNKVGVDLLAHREAGEQGYFMAMISPTQLAAGQAAVTEQDIVAKDVVFCVDTSYSMVENGKIEQAKKALAYCVRHLRKGDRFNIVDFSTEARSFQEQGMVEATPAKIKRALKYVSDIEASGGTAIHEALERSIKQFGASDRLKMILFMTDGLPTIGEQNPQRILKDITARNKQDVRMFVFGEGYDVNARMLDHLALDNRGDSDYILPREDIAKKIARFFDKVGSPIMTDLKISLSGVKAADVYPRQLPDLFKGEQVIVYGRYDATGKQTVTLSGKVNGQPRSLTYELDFPAEAERHDFVPRLWGGQKVSHLLSLLRKQGENKEMVSEVVALSKRFGIVTPYTAYLVTQDVVRPGAAGLAQNFRGRFKQGLRGGAGNAQPQSAPEKKAQVQDALGFSATRRALKSGKVLELAEAHDGEDNGKDDKARLDRETRRMRVMRYIGAKTFYKSDGVWYDSAWDAKQKIQPMELVVGEEAYFQTIAKHRGITKYLALGDVVFQYKATWYRIKLKK